VGSHCAWADEKSLTYLTIRQAACHESEDLALTLREVGDLGLGTRIGLSGVRIFARSEHNGRATKVDPISVSERMLFD
jgi:hypothetical protein